MSRTSKVRARQSWRVWCAPIALAMVTAIGLACALLSDGQGWRLFACLCLTVPLVVIGGACARARPDDAHDRG